MVVEHIVLADGRDQILDGILPEKVSVDIVALDVVMARDVGDLIHAIAMRERAQGEIGRAHV